MIYFIIGILIGSIITSFYLIKCIEKSRFKINGVQFSKHKNGEIYIECFSGKFILKNGMEIKNDLMRLDYNSKLFDKGFVKYFKEN